MELHIGSRLMSFDDPGAGKPVVLLHPFPFDRRFWAQQVARLGARYRVITPDMRGFGKSSRDGDFSINDLADDVAALLDHLKIPKAVIGGISMGGYVSLAFAVRHPDRVNGLVLADTKAGGDSEAARAAREEALALVLEQGVDAYVEKQLPRFVATPSLEHLRPQIKQLTTQAPESVMAGLRALRDRPDRTADLPQMTPPAVVIVGEDDVLTPLADAQALVAGLPRAALIQIPNAGHLPPLESPNAFGDALLGFVAAHAH